MSPHTTGAVAPGRLGGRVLLLIVASLTTLLALGFLLNDIVRTVYLWEGAYTLEVALGTQLAVDANLPSDSEQNTSFFSTALITSFENLDESKTLQVLAIWLTTLTFLVAAIVIVLLCRQLWTGRTFGASSATGVLGLAVAALVTAWLTPWLRHRADTIAFEQLGYDPRVAGPLVQLRQYDLGAIDGPLLVLGIVLLLAGLVYLGARRLQNDTKGLV